ncbi:MAG: GntR family transcriptional regulator [Burkholderiales bacterium]|nr:GntR family transcriptional regulator [Burkholderiales bacterium]
MSEHTKSATLAQSVTQTLRQWILEGSVAAGERLEEIPLAERLDVSRTPVRSALSALAEQGLLDYQANRGYLVRAFGPDQVAAAYEVRAALEGLACRLAAERGLSVEQRTRLEQAVAIGDRVLAHKRLRSRDHAPYRQMNVTIHDTIIEASGNEWVPRFVREAHTIPFASDRLILWHDFGVIERSHEDHRRILRAIVGRNGARAEDLMREHIYFAGQFLRDNWNRVHEVSRMTEAAEPGVAAARRASWTVRDAAD